MTPTPQTLRDAFVSGLDGAARVRVRRPNSLFQVELPAYMGDGDAAAIYVRPRRDGGLIVTDLGSTRARISYQRKLSAEIDAEIARLATDQGLRLEDGEIRAEVPMSELLAASLGLLQVEAQAERLAATTTRRTQEASHFRDEVLELLRSMFEGLVREPFFDEERDREALYKVDALISTKTPLAVALIPGNIDAERAVGAKFALRDVAPPRTRWVAIPRNMEQLSSETRKRLTREYNLAAPVFEEDRDVVQSRLRDLADVA